MNTKSISKTTPIHKLDLNKVKDIIFQDIYRLLDSFSLEYRQDGDNIFMCCPVHSGSDNPTGCSISNKLKLWKCWTHSCHEHYGSDIFGFIKGVLDTSSFSEVLSYISKIYKLKEAEGHTKQDNVIENDLQKILKHFRERSDEPFRCDFCEVNTCGSSPYFESRGFKPETLRLFGVEDCNDKNSPMKLRSIIPIYFQDKQVGYIARATKPWLNPKYLFSDGFRKTDYFYNWDKAIEHSVSKRTMFLVEGQGDVWRMYEAGVKNCVGLFGKSISERQKRMLLTNEITNLVILTDNDSAGREAKTKIKREFNRLFRLIFPPMHSKDLGNLTVEKLQSDILLGLKDLY
jgi:DNA primase